jgi:anti-anti-sigma factor
METVTWDDREGVRWIQLEGELDNDVCLALKEGFLEAVLGGRGDVVVVLEGVGFLSSMGIGMLNDARQELARKGRVLRLHGLKPALRRVLEAMNLMEVFEEL